jgi:hypothetical protein
MRNLLYYGQLFERVACYQENFYTSLRTCRCLVVDDRSLGSRVNGRLIRRKSNGRLLYDQGGGSNVYNKGELPILLEYNNKCNLDNEIYILYLLWGIDYEGRKVSK